MAYNWAYRGAYCWTSVAVIAAAVGLMQLWGTAAASEPGIARASYAARSGAIPGEFQALVGDRVFFSEGSAELGARARRALAAQADWLARNPTVRVTIEGHADDPGGDDNALSQRRAEAVRQRLIETGIAPERIRTVAYGRGQLIAACTDPLCGPQNRRVVTVVGWATAVIEPAHQAQQQGRELGRDAVQPRLRLLDGGSRPLPRRL